MILFYHLSGVMWTKFHRFEKSYPYSNSYFDKIFILAQTGFQMPVTTTDSTEVSDTIRQLEQFSSSVVTIAWHAPVGSLPEEGHDTLLVERQATRSQPTWQECSTWSNALSAQIRSGQIWSSCSHDWRYVTWSCPSIHNVLVFHMLIEAWERSMKYAQKILSTSHESMMEINFIGQNWVALVFLRGR